jgi:tRNA dimethylallyltransferase
MKTVNTVVVIGGPTASGKSGLALSLARQKNGTIINADSMQLYDGLHRLTAQPSREDLEQAPHVLYSCLKSSDVCSAALWRDMALVEIDKAIAAGRLPIIVGGTGFYIRTLLLGISPIPDIPATVREEANRLQKEMGNPAFHAELQKRDPAMAAKLHPFNTQRLVRAWEVLAATGESLAKWQELPMTPPPAHLRFISVTLLPERKQLYSQCDSRFGQMVAGGVLDEVKNFKAEPQWPLAKALGYPELSSHLAGNITLPEAIDMAQRATRHYAKRQVTWFRHQLKPDLVLDRPDAAKLASAIF